MYILIKKEKIEIEEVIDKYSDMVYRVAYTRLNQKESEEDIYQEVFLQLAKKSPTFESFEHLKAWLIRVTINKSKNILSSVWNREVDYLENDIPIEEINNLYVFEEVKKLKQSYRTVIYLYYYEGYKISEISSLMKIKESTIKTWMLKARNILKEKLEGGFDDE